MRTSRKHFADRKKLSRQAISQAVHGMEALESRTLFNATLIPTVSEIASPTSYTQGQGSGVTLQASVLGNGGLSPSGTVTFFEGSNIIGTPQTLVAGSVILTNVTTLRVGVDSITADYSGDSNFVPTNSAAQVVTVTGSGTTTVGTTTALSATPSGSAAAGANVMLTAVVSPASSGPTITGTVTFFDGTTTLGTGNVDGTGTATFSTTTLPSGSNTLSATYGGDTNYSASNSNTVSETITTSSGTTPSTVSVSTTGPSSVTFGTPVTFDATVAPTGATGTVQFLSGSTSLGTGNVDPTTGLASVTTSMLPLGSDSITAVYSGDSNFATSTSPPITETVTPGAMTPTTTTVSTTTPTITAGSSVTFTANVAPVGATGTVQFLSGSTSLGSSNLNSATGVATFMTSNLAVGSDSITAVYSGDANNASSTSSPITETVNPATLTPTTTTVNTTTPTITAGNPVTFTANVAPSGATGTVEFFSNGNSLGTGMLDGTGNATVTTSALTAGSDIITATYDGDSNFAGSTSANFTETVNPAIATTTTTVTTNPNTMFGVGTTVMLTATINPTTATGTVQFFDGMTALGAPVTVVNGAATLSTGALIVGSHTITATYSGDAGDMPSTSTPVTINGTIGTPTLTTSSSAPMISLGDSVTFTATVAPMAADGPVPTGTVIFNDGMTAISGTVTLVNGVATFADPSLTVGSHSISFTYSGDTNYAMGTAPAIIETVGTGATTTTLTVSPNPILFGQSVTLTATISPSAATGTVTFFDGTRQLGLPATVTNGVATLADTSLETGTDSLTAVYSGDANYSPSTSTATTETVNTAPSTTVLTTDINQVVFGNPVRLTANVPIAGATGTVSFYSDGNLIGTSNLNNGGVANLVASSLAVGNDTLTAVYSGDSNYNASTSNGVVVAVSQGLTNTTIFANPTVIAVGAPVTFTVTVASNINGLPTPTGTVTLTEDGVTILASGLALVNGTATFTTTDLSLGQDSIVATYNGDPTYLTSVSTTPALVGVSAVTATTSTTTLTSTTPSPNYGDAVTFTAVVAPALTSSFTASGTVTFYDGSVPLGAPVALSGGVALFTTSSMPPGINSITAVYNGDNNFNPSTSAPVQENVIGNNNSGLYVTTLNVSTFNAAFGAPVTLTASVLPTNPATPPPFGGTVTFFSGAQTIGAATLGANGNAVFSTPLPAGTDEITAAYNGGGPITASLPRMVAISSPATPSLAKANLPPAIVAGTAFHTNLPISVTNLGVSALKGLFTIQVYLDSSTTLDANRDLLTTISKTFNLNGGKSRVFHTPETFSPTLPDGTYYVLVDVTDPNGLTNLVASQPVVVAAPFVALNASVSATNPTNLAVGQSASLFVTLTNTGNEAISGLLDLTLTASSDGVTQIPGKILGTGSLNTTIQPGKSKKYRVVLDTTALADGSYFPYITASLDGVSATAVGVTPFRIG